jgi:hypothetical protein
MIDSSLDLSFGELGFAIAEQLISYAECDAIIAELGNLALAKIGSRVLLKQLWCSELAIKLRNSLQLKSYLLPNQVAIQCTYFEKSIDKNWLVPFHQDLSIPVAEKINHPKLKLWSVKEDTVFVQPPEEILDQLTAVRLHLDENELNDGSLKVIPSSHQSGKLEILSPLKEKDGNSVICSVPKGGVLIMKPLLLHSSSKSFAKNKRRVLHFLFAPSNLPFGLRWQYYV